MPLARCIEFIKQRRHFAVFARESTIAKIEAQREDFPLSDSIDSYIVWPVFLDLAFTDP
ncbi:hypothetical protein AGR4A_Cc260015 [Agrobacterium tumefaciens str. B6]|uniref:Uncharacterized protein n=2 Tax=Agrobacterium tumefaciens TaxID=358 RepID=A0A822V266_AGRTU|nr:conserved hypothetical protein [Agrobacterium tumefaciens str. CFBP 5621]CUX15262.1 hypothetical protein AGR4C_Cc160006 [Agrobacterium tumefaciens str. Kerr 14]CVI17435.1 hypothetical protein AGR4A_Cc260015 [Agrobacterium tumefaciens str. B6]